MPMDNGFNDDSTILFNLGVDLTGVIDGLNEAENVINNGVKKVNKKSKNIDLGVTKNSSKEIEDINEQLLKLQNELNSIQNNKLSKSTFQKYKTEFISQILSIEKRLDELSSSLSTVIQQLSTVGINVNLSDVINQFKSMKDVVIETSDAIEKMSDVGADSISASLSSKELKEFQKVRKELLEEKKKTSKVLDEEETEVFNRLGTQSLDSLVNYFKETYKDAAKLQEKIKELWRVYNDAPEGSDLIPYAEINKATLEFTRLNKEAANARDVIEKVINEMDIPSQDKKGLLDKYINPKALQQMSSAIDVNLQASQKRAIEAQETLETINKLINSTKKAEAPSSAAVKQSEETLEKVEKTYSTYLRLSELLSSGSIEIAVDTDTESLRKKLDDEIFTLQEHLKKKSLIVPVKIVLNNTKDNSENPLATSQTAIEQAQRAKKEIVGDIDSIAEKGLNKVLQSATTGVETFVRDAKKEFTSIFDTEYIVNFKANPQDLENLKRQIQITDFLDKGTLAINLEYANQVAKELAKNIKDVLKLIDQEHKKQSEVNILKPKKETKAQHSKELDEMMGKLEQYKEGAERVLAYVQKSVFDKKPVYLNLKPSDESLNALRADLETVLNEDNDLTSSLKNARDIAEEIVKILTPLNGLEIKLSGSGKTGIIDNSESLKKDFDGLYTAMALIQKGNTKIESILNESSVKQTHQELQVVKTDFSDVNIKIEELIETSKLLVQDLRSDISSISELFKTLEEHFSNISKDNSLQTLSNLDLSTLEKNLASIFELLVQIVHKLDGLSVKETTLDKALVNDTTRTQLNELNDVITSLTTSLTSINELQNISKVFNSLNIKDNVLTKINQLPDDLKLISEKLKEIDNTPTDGFIKELKEITAQADGLKSLAEVLKNSKKQIQAALDLQNKSPNDAWQRLMSKLDSTKDIEKQFKSYSKAGTFETTQPKEYAEVLGLIEDKLTEIDKIRKFHANDNKTADETVGQIFDTRKLDDIIAEVQQLFGWLDNIKAKNAELNGQLKEELSTTEKFSKQFQKVLDSDGTNERKFTSEYTDVLREIKNTLSETEKYGKLKITSENDLNNIKDLNERLETLFRTLESISTYSSEITSSLKDQLKTELSTAKKFESDYYRKWGYGAIPENFPNDYSVQLGEIKSKLEEIKTIEERFKNGIYTEEDVSRIKVLNSELETAYKNLSQISHIAKDTKITNLQEKISKYMVKNTRLTTGMYNQLGNLLKELEGADLTAEDLNKIATAFNKIQYSARLAGKEGAGFLDAIKNKLKYGWAQSIAMFFSFYDIVRYAREISSAVTELNSNLIELAKVSDTSVGDLYKQFSEFADIAKETGGTVNDIIKSTADWARNGYNLPDSKELARLSSIFQNIGDGLSEAQANEYLVSTLKGFNLEANQAIEIMDKINNVSNNAASSVANIGEALERSSASFGAAKTNLSQAIALVTTSNEVLQNPETVGEFAPTCTVMYIIKSSYIG